MVVASRRKSWDQLSDTYKKRLTKAGVTPEQHAHGVGLSKARGHVSKERENRRRRETRQRKKDMERRFKAWRENNEEMFYHRHHLIRHGDTFPEKNAKGQWVEVSYDDLKNVDPEVLDAALDEQERIMATWEDEMNQPPVDPETMARSHVRSHNLWQHRDKSIPEWFWYYHGWAN